MESLVFLLYSFQLAEKKDAFSNMENLYFISYAKFTPWGCRRVQLTLSLKSGEVAPTTNEKKYHSGALPALAQAKHMFFVARELNEKQCLS